MTASVDGRRWMLAAAAAVLALAAPLTAAAREHGEGEVVRVNLADGAATQNLSLPRGKSAVIELPVDARDVIVSNPKVADVALRTPRRIFVMGMGSGSTDAAFFDASGRRILRVNIRVDADVNAVEETLGRVLGRSSVRAEAAGENIILTGQVANLAERDRAERESRSFVARPEMVLNMTTIAGKEQVMLKVRVVEVQRTAIKQLGVNFSAVLNQIGEPQYLLSNAASFAINGSLLGGATGGYNLNTTRQPTAKQDQPFFTGNYDASGRPIYETRTYDVIDRNYGLSTPTDTVGDPGLNKAESTIQALERVGLVRTLAEPNLTAISGEAANFLAGGEFPVPVGQDTNGQISIEFKKFGVGLGFTPVVLSEGRISLRISTEVSELTNLGSFSISGGVTIPGLSVRRAETTVELPSGGAMMIAGLLQSRHKQNIDKVPGLGSLPVLGSLFRSRDFINDETELVVIVTPYLVNSVHPSKLQTPADGLQIAGDLKTIFLGKLNEVYRPNAGVGAPTAAYQGPVGPVIE